MPDPNDELSSDSFDFEKLFTGIIPESEIEAMHPIVGAIGGTLATTERDKAALIAPMVQTMKRELAGFAEKTLGDFKEHRDGTVRVEIDYFDLTAFAEAVLGVGQSDGDSGTSDSGS